MLVKKLIVLVFLVIALAPRASQGQESEWIVAARGILEPVLSAEYDREMTGVVAYAGNQSIAQIVALAFPLSPAEMAMWQQRFATALGEAGAAGVDVNGDDEVEAEDVPASPKPAKTITCSTGEHEGQEGIVCTSVPIPTRGTQAGGNAPPQAAQTWWPGDV